MRAQAYTLPQQCLAVGNDQYHDKGSRTDTVRPECVSSTPGIRCTEGCEQLGSGMDISSSPLGANRKGANWLNGLNMAFINTSAGIR